MQRRHHVVATASRWVLGPVGEDGVCRAAPAAVDDADVRADAAVRPAPASRARWSAVVFALVAGLCVGYVLAYAQIAGRAPVDGPVDCRDGRP